MCKFGPSSSGIIADFSFFQKYAAKLNHGRFLMETWVHLLFRKKENTQAEGYEITLTLLKPTTAKLRKAREHVEVALRGRKKISYYGRIPMKRKVGANVSFCEMGAPRQRRTENRASFSHPQLKSIRQCRKLQCSWTLLAVRCVFFFPFSFPFSKLLHDL